MSGSGVTYYDEELKYLLRLLKALPDDIPIGDAHNFLDYTPNPEKVKDTGCVKSVVSHSLEVSFGARRTGAGETIEVKYKSRGLALEEVTTVLRDHITGNAGANKILVLWVDDLIRAAVNTIEAADCPLPRIIQTTAPKRRLEDEAIVEQAKKKQKKDEKVEKAAKKAQTDEAKKRTEQGPLKWAFDDLEDDPAPPPPTGNVRGKPKLVLLDKLVIPCHSIKEPDTRRVRCAGTGCHESWAHPRSSTRILPHSSECKFLSRELRNEAVTANAGASLGARVIDANHASDTGDMFAGFKAAGAESKAAARKAREEKTNFLTMNLLCDAGLPTALVGNPSFRALVNHLDPVNGIKVASTFSSSYIPAEAARVTLLAIEELKKQDNLSLGYDGGTTLGQQSIYTVHVTTPDREVYFIKGDEASGFSHTGVHIKNLILEVMDLIGRQHFASLGSDSTGNTKLGRELVQADVATVLIVPDPCHHLSNTIKDICVIEYFVDCIGKMRTTITYFSHSTYSATHLKVLRVILDINKGLEKIGKTRFGTLYWSSHSLLRCLSAISELINTGIINVESSDKDKSKLAWFKQLRAYQNFELELQQLTALCGT
ncbi:hypothetical protein B0H10DRAFT_2219962 [Mycena sp. CBHHK59/15]|nr:hypothetical protein B0H10DRAFT_2219962 [Mycena sp. CBHHK59/15]